MYNSCGTLTCLLCPKHTPDISSVYYILYCNFKSLGPCSSCHTLHHLLLRVGEENVGMHVCADAGCTCLPRSYLRSIGCGRGSHRSAQCIEANLCHCSGDPSVQRYQGVKFKLLLQPSNSIIWGKDMSLWHILAVFFV